MNKNNFWKGINVITDTAWGDSGKGKLVDLASQNVDMVIRYNGGGNAGHTVKNDKGIFKNHLMPSGIYNPKALCILTGGVVIDLFMLVQEILEHRAKGVKISPKNLLISQDAHLVMPWHKRRDGLKEKARGGAKIGTTGQGIGPTYSDRKNREGIRMSDLLDRDFEKIFEKEIVYQERLTRLMDGELLLSEIGNKKLKPSKIKESQNPYFNKKEILNKLRDVKEILAPMIANVLPIIWKYQDQGKNILGEGAQGALLDLELGGYPYVTSSHPGVAGFSLSTGIQHKDVSKVVGVTKAYTTRVGEGPMPTELFDETGQYIQKQGGEFGATTGRPRRCGWLDIPAVKYGIRITGVNSIALMKLDVLDELKEVEICVGYTVNNKQYKDLPTADPKFMSNAKPNNITLTGWQENTSGVKTFKDLPRNAQKYILTVQKLLGIPAEIISVGPERDATISVV